MIFMSFLTSALKLTINSYLIQSSSLQSRTKLTAAWFILHPQGDVHTSWTKEVACFGYQDVNASFFFPVFCVLQASYKSPPLILRTPRTSLEASCTLTATRQRRKLCGMLGCTAEADQWLGEADSPGPGPRLHSLSSSPLHPAPPHCSCQPVPACFRALLHQSL